MAIGPGGQARRQLLLFALGQLRDQEFDWVGPCQRFSSENIVAQAISQQTKR